MISQIMIGICCFFVGNIVGILFTSFCQKNETPDDVQHCDTCDKCLGVLFDECKTCPKKEGKLDADKM